MNRDAVEVEEAWISRTLRRNGQSMSRMEIAGKIKLDPASPAFRVALDSLLEKGRVAREMRCTSEVLETFVAVYRLAD